jgi:hypothetical protein
MHYDAERKFEGQGTSAENAIQHTLYAAHYITQGATWWAPRVPEEKLPFDTRRLIGEIHVSPSLKAAFQLPECRLFVRTG